MLGASLEWTVVMSRSIRAKLVRYGYDGEYLSRPVTLDAIMVMDEDHGVVLEIVLPRSGGGAEENAVFICAAELRKILADPCAGVCIQ